MNQCDSTSLIPLTRCFKSFGDADASWSAQNHFARSVKCFSIIFAPKATAAIAP